MVSTRLDTPCIEYPGYRNRAGYGVIRRKGKSWLAHRWTWTQQIGPIPDGLCVLHKCDNPPCMNVDHLWVGTMGDNVRDREAKGRGRPGNHYANATHCKRGHEFTPDNVYLHKRPDGRVSRDCRECRRIREGDG